ncbi:DUF2461 domain-containing protein [Aquimarina agarivorans]|uniref:DUF2461 domain-containing protein n=1 Tax=Aquimarina agarivorans TaxID=980584 RepID=UPI000248F610|nr:DUF2461 domain-containing protein [Aquimarina agarivorans]
MAGVATDLLDFLDELKENNHRDWFEEHKPTFKKLEVDFKALGTEILEGLNQTDSIEKMKVFRIYKDVRFSKDKTPYKTNRSISFSREGAALRGGYYLHIEPANSFIAGGFFSPNPADLLRIRKEFEMDDQEIRALMANKKFSKVFGSTFVPYAQVKTAPKGFSKDHAAIDLIKNKSFFFEKKLTNSEITATDFSKKVVEYYELLRPYFNYMSDVLTTDLNGVSLLKE